nr:MAG TPA: hypothetical protein [Crassvirales sp.]
MYLEGESNPQVPFGTADFQLVTIPVRLCHHHAILIIV